MRCQQFTVPFPDNRTIIAQREVLPHFYPHLHRHKEIQLTWVIEGEGTLVTDNNVRPFYNNQVYWIGANQSHVFKNDPVYFEKGSRKQIQHIDIYFNPERLAAFLYLPELVYLNNFILGNNTGFSVSAEEVAEVSEKMLLVTNATGFEQFFQFIGLLKHIISIEKKLEPLTENAEQVSYNDDEGMRIATIYNYVMQNYQQPITLGEVSKIAFMTPQAFCRYFKKHTHHTLVSFVNQMRINEACKKLVSKKGESIASVAYDTGFNSITNFNRVFKSVTKKSPKEYIESYCYESKQDARIA